MNRRHGLACLVLAGLIAGLCLSGSNQAAEPSPKTIRIGMVSTLFHDVPDSMIEMMAKPFGMLMSAQTGMTGQLIKTGDANDLGRKLTSGEVQVGICHGFEFAWVRQNYPTLKPLAIAINQSARLRAYLVVNSTSTITGFADLKDKTLDLPKGTRAHCRLYLDSRCQETGQCSPENMLAKLTSSDCAEDAIDDVIGGNVAATVVDNITLETYKHRKPGRYENLKVVAESEDFPAGVVVYNAGSLDEKTLGKFRDGLINCNKTILGRQLLTLWKLTGFEKVPADYDQLLTDIAKAYPPPPAEAEDSDEK
jgi:ABC-type phosphate/phosphonate transport system substrate-binding protein